MSKSTKRLARKSTVELQCGTHDLGLDGAVCTCHNIDFTSSGSILLTSAETDLCANALQYMIAIGGTPEHVKAMRALLTRFDEMGATI